MRLLGSLSQGWRLVSAIFLHAGVFHFLLNMSMVLRLIWPFEKDVGSRKVAFIYLFSGVFSSVYR